jgi:hypothetical protein
VSIVSLPEGVLPLPTSRPEAAATRVPGASWVLERKGEKKGSADICRGALECMFMLLWPCGVKRRLLPVEYSCSRRGDGV